MKVETKFDPNTCTETTTLSLDGAEDVVRNHEYFYACLDKVADELDDHEDPSAPVYHSVTVTVVKKNHAIN